MTRRIAPFIAVAILSLGVAFALGPSAQRDYVLAAALIIPGLLMAIYLVPWGAFPAWAQAAPLIIAVSVGALLRDAFTAGPSLLIPLLMLPILWLALYGTRTQLLICLFAATVSLIVPSVILDPSRYPHYELARALILALVAGCVGLSVNMLVRRMRSLALQYGSIVQTADDAFVSIDASGAISEWNARAERDFGWSRQEVLGRRFAECVVPPRRRQEAENDLHAFLTTGEERFGEHVELNVLRRDGNEFPVEVKVATVFAGDGRAIHAFLRDVSDRRAHERALREAEELFRRAFDDAATGMTIISPDGRYLRVNDAFSRITGHPTAELVGRRAREITHPDDVSRDLEAMQRFIAGERSRFEAEKRYVRPDGRTVWTALSASAVRDPHGDLVCVVCQTLDISARKATEARLEHQALHDPLTGLPNRVLFNDRMEVARGRLQRGGSLAVLFLDIDYFKSINDRFGHEAGDTLLREAGARLRGVLRPSDTVARFGGDEFALLCDGVDEAVASSIATRIAERFESPILLEGREVTVSVSIGIAVERGGERSVSAIVNDADTAMYRAKQQGRGRYAFSPGSLPHTGDKHGAARAAGDGTQASVA